MDTEFIEKYDNLIDCIGINRLEPLVKPLKTQIERALAQGDIHLNRIELGVWDNQANPAWFPIPQNTPLSLAERVCILKHAARRLYGKV